MEELSILQGFSKDSLTKFYMKEALNPFLDSLIQNLETTKKGFSVAIVDIDRFKKFNDKYGHLFGDEVLKYIASTLRLTLMDEGYIFRYGGDEFVIVFPNKDAELAFQFMRRCNYSVANRPFSYKGKLIITTISCGVAYFPKDAKIREKLLKKADDALYFSKHFGRNATTLASKMIYIKLRRIFLFMGGIFVFLVLVLTLSQYVFKDFIKYTINKVKKIKVVEEEPKNLDSIILKRGSEIKGNIIEDKDGQIIVSIELDKGRGTLVINKSEIAHIRYGAGQSPQDNPQLKSEKTK